MFGLCSFSSSGFRSVEWVAYSCVVNAVEASVSFVASGLSNVFAGGSDS